MKNIRDVLTEVKGEKAHKQAVAMGLKYKGFGYWLDPSTGQVAYKTENDTLVPVEPDVESEKAGKELESPEGAAPSGGVGNPQGAGGSFGTFMNKQNPLGTGTNVQGIADTGLAQAPNTDEGRWEPGPDGDNFVNDQTLRDVNKPPKDAFVGKTNYYNWTAGPEGDNYSTLTMADMFKAALNLDNKDVKITEAEDPGRKTMFKKMIGFQDLSADDPSVVQQARDVYQQQSDTGKGQMMRDVAGKDTFGMKMKMDKLPAKMARRDNRKDIVKRLNTSIKDLVDDPNYDMSQTGQELGSGMFGSVYESADGKNVIKKGTFGPKELAVLAKLRDLPQFPNLVNAELTSPFESGDDIYHQGTESENDNMGTAREWFNEMPMAEGTMAMSKINGYPYNEAKDSMTEEETQKFMQKLWAARAAMHKLGISHNDMHAGNFFMDDKGNPAILDLGLADDNPLSALMEALGGVSGKDSQLNADARMSEIMNFVPDALQSRVRDNVESLRERLMDMFDKADIEDGYTEEDDYPDDIYDQRREQIERLLKGGIRQTPEQLEDITNRFPFLANTDMVKGLIEMFYNNVSETETGQRMSNAYDKLKVDREKIALDNLRRKRRGAPEIQDRLKDALDPDN